jgi:hypothetical protein
MFIRKKGALEQALEILEANIQGYYQANRTPEREPTAHPVPKVEHILCRYPKFTTSFLICGDCYEVFGYFFLRGVGIF